MSIISGIKARLNGARAEQRASQYLISKGLTLVAQNYHCKWGEIDLIFEHGQQLVFVEVKSRESNEFGEAEEYFTKRKRAKLTRALMHYMQEKRLNPNHTDFRIDVVAITGQEVAWHQAV